jgi:hypothetical protein
MLSQQAAHTYLLTINATAKQVNRHAYLLPVLRRWNKSLYSCMELLAHRADADPAFG